MRRGRGSVLAVLLAAAAPAVAQEGPAPACPPEHAAVGHCAPPPAAAPPPASSEPENAADRVWGADAMAPARRAIYAEHGSMRTSAVMLDRFEYRVQDGRDGYHWEGEGWTGGDYDRLWIKSRGEGEFGERIDTVETQALWSHALDPWFNLQAGVRYDVRRTADRAYLTVGVEGLAPYLFEIAAAAFVSDRGDLAARVEATYDQRIVRQLVLQPRAELNLSTGGVRSVGTGAGVSSVEAGVRLRYEIVPEFAPYVGVEYERAIGRAVGFTRAAGKDAGGAGLVAGVRVWF